MTKQEQIKMYEKLSKKELIELLMKADRDIDILIEGIFKGDKACGFPIYPVYPTYPIYPSEPISPYYTMFIDYGNTDTINTHIRYPADIRVGVKVNNPIMPGSTMS